MQLVGKTFKATLPSGEVSVIQVVDRISVEGSYCLRFYKRGIARLQLSKYGELKRAIQNHRAVVAANHYQATEWMHGIFHDTTSCTLSDHIYRMRMATQATTPVNRTTPTGQWIST